MAELGRFAQVSLDIARAVRAKRVRRPPVGPAREAHRRVHAWRPERLTRTDFFGFMETFLWVFADVDAYCADDEREATGLESDADDPDKVRTRACEMWVRAMYRREVFEQHRREFEDLCRRAGYPWIHEDRPSENEKAAGDTATFDVNNYPREEEEVA